MPDELTTAPTSASASLDECARLVLQAKESGGDWRPVIDWLARNPGRAAGLAGFLAAERGLEVFAASGGPPQIPRLELKEVIGKGGMGVVRRAYDPNLKREVAVKLVLPEADLVRFR